VSDVPARLARTFVDGIAAKDEYAIASVFDQQVDFRGLTPSNEWRATSPSEIVEIVLGSWFEPKDRVREVLEVETVRIADRHQMRYRFRVENPDGAFLVEQHAYFDAPNGAITRMSAVCSGFRPWEEFSPAK
jgi:hypothetical protein